MLDFVPSFILNKLEKFLYFWLMGFLWEVEGEAVRGKTLQQRKTLGAQTPALDVDCLTCASSHILSY